MLSSKKERSFHRVRRFQVSFGWRMESWKWISEWWLWLKISWDQSNMVSLKTWSCQLLGSVTPSGGKSWCRKRSWSTPLKVSGPDPHLRQSPFTSLWQHMGTLYLAGKAPWKAPFRRRHPGSVENPVRALHQPAPRPCAGATPGVWPEHSALEPFSASQGPSEPTEHRGQRGAALRRLLQVPLGAKLIPGQLNNTGS